MFLYMQTGWSISALATEDVIIKDSANWLEPLILDPVMNAIHLNYFWALFES